MSSLYLLIPLSILMLISVVALFFWAIRNKQFDDFEGPASKIILDDALEYKVKKKKPVAKQDQQDQEK